MPNSVFEYENLNWATSPCMWKDLLQVTDSYVCHARGWTVYDDVYLDRYNVMGEHKRWWSTWLSEEYGCDWRETDKQTLYWSVTGSSAFLLQFPHYEDIEDEAFGRLIQTLRLMDVPDDAMVQWSTRDGGFKTMLAGKLFGERP